MDLVPRLTIVRLNLALVLRAKYDAAQEAGYELNHNNHGAA